MGKLTNGIAGTHTGKVGNIISYMLNGQNVTRSVGKNNKPKTVAQKNNMMGMKLINGFFYQMYGFVKESFAPSCRGTVYNYQNLYVRYNKPGALKGYYPNLEIDYSKIIFSVGNLPQPVSAKVERIAEGLKFSWDTTLNCSSPECMDQVMMMACFPGGLEPDAIFKTRGATRDQGFDILPLPDFFKNKVMEIYMTFISDDRLDVTNSMYLGRIEPQI